MPSKHYCLKWNSFQTNILSAFESLQNTEDLADVTLTCDGINLRAHKFILSACSPYFRTVFKENPCSHPIVILKDVAYPDLIAIINFMYHGEVTVTEEQLTSFLETAMVLQVSGLINSQDSITPKKLPIQSTLQKKNKNLDTIESPAKKSKTSPKPKKVETPENQQTASHFECLEIETIKTESSENDTDDQYPDVNENVEVIVSEKNDPGSILEAALEIREKPSSILERSLMSHPCTAKPSIFTTDKQPTESPKTAYISRKHPDGMSFEKPPDIGQPYIKVEGDSCESSGTLSPDGDSSSLPNVRSIEMQQPHHSSQCGNCPHCGKIYSNQSALKYHVRLVHSDLTNMYCCHLCPESFDYRDGFKKHMAEVHFIRN